MDFIDNLKKVSKNWRLLALVIWLLIGVAIIPYPNPVVSLIGIIIFFPFLVFLMFLFLLSLVSKKSIFEYPPWKIILFLLVSLPIMALISIVLILLFVISVITYFLFTSWFILYGCFLIGRRVDKQALKTVKAKPFIRTLIFIGGLAASIFFLYLFIIAPKLFDFSVISDAPMPWYLNGVYILVGAILIGLAITIVVYKFHKVFNGWFGIFAILVSFYTLFLVIKIYLGLTPTKTTGFGPIWAYLTMIIPDLLIIFYSLSTLMGSQAEFLSKKLKRFELDTVIIWLLLSKVTYEFIHYFPYDLLSGIQIPWIQWFADNIDNDLINQVKNIAVLGFFVLLLIIIGLYEIMKYSEGKLKAKKEGKIKLKEIIFPESTIEEPETITEESKTIEDIDPAIFKEEDFKEKNNNEPEKDLPF